jgi:two-component system phosphate regulon sensor histidine kinase PhoR
MTKRIFKSIFLAAFCVLLASLVIITGCLYEYYSKTFENQMKDELDLAAAAVDISGSGYLKAIAPSGYRLSLIDKNGKVLYDTVQDADTLANHADRDEVKQALENGDGSSTRYSSTLLKKTTYIAKKLGNGNILRISSSRATVGMLVFEAMQPILIVIVAALIISAVIASRLSKRIVEPLNSLDLEHPLENNTYDELAPLLGRINRQHEQINDQLGALRKKTDEFEQITDNMKEGLVLLDNDGKILSINPAACRLFETTRDCIGSDFLSIDRSLEISSAIKLADESGHSETREKYGDRTYQFDVSRIESDGAARGSVILFFDMTEQQNSEKIRREFTANVSHELKTPLQGIIGSAELIENGMVRDEDMPRFVGHIRSEAQRLVSLINDIIRLSQLDEGDEMPRENVGILSLSQEISEDLGAAAKKKNVTLNVGGHEAYVFGVPRLLYEIVYNLCDNAIKYNREGGRVDISVENENGSAVLTVSDTGIGIAPKHQARIFERFYRVDKSHSKATGGTGLGLSIVKHAVLCHGGTLSLESEENKGTRITVTLPLSK